ncbi:NAD(P)H-dependent oxidoreductase [Allokutzneria sp. A3M-2-11 16]|uniref:NADPH-dependent FMN reductase n=1 Tax=Allokutzneria sp. A3M-2-11 16 TaxID=2962043 RepID=UPI0020B7BB35|nr:NAD(P)H-dependent oxidoreductase [Allokutzneria sp. A3M-2-11 16]MCP3801075.1 NAD(P)H-dependent oxidoreductase [Allokutzneria sp. A3M-2-11 16]
MTRIAVLIGSTRPGRRGVTVADWVAKAAAEHAAVAAGEVEIDVIDLADHSLPLLDEPVPALAADYRHEHTRNWAEVIGSYDGFVFVTPEYNHSFPAALKNAIDYLFAEWNDKAAGFVSYGAHGGIRAVEQLRPVLAEVKLATVRTQVFFSMAGDIELFTDPDAWTASSYQVENLSAMLDELIAWSAALKPLRAKAAA